LVRWETFVFTDWLCPFPFIFHPKTSKTCFNLSIYLSHNSLSKWNKSNNKMAQTIQHETIKLQSPWVTHAVCFYTYQCWNTKKKSRAILIPFRINRCRLFLQRIVNYMQSELWGTKQTWILYTLYFVSFKNWNFLSFFSFNLLKLIS
jgi:hypothetical protein